MNVESELHSCLEEQCRLDDDARTRRRMMNLKLPRAHKHSLLVTSGHMSNNDGIQSPQGSITTLESSSLQR